MSQDALDLEVSILEALWIRNRSSHGRTRYFQRCRMVLQCIRNNNNDLLSVSNRIQELARRVDGYQQYGSVIKKKKTSTNKKRDEEWTLSDLQQQQQQQQQRHDDKTSSASPDVEWIQQEWKDLYQITTMKLPEILSRIEYAASALYTEVARGFFLPLCTVCLGTLGRIRVILMKFGREWLQKLQEFLKIIMSSSHVMLLKECEINTTSITTAWDTAMEAFVEPASETKVVSRRVEHQQDEEFWRQLGLTRPLIRKDDEESGLAQGSSTRQDYKADPQSPSEDHDVGESVDWTTADEDVNETMVARSANNDDNDDMAGIDRNAHVLASLQKEKSSQKRPRQDIAESSTTKKQRKKQSKKEKKSKKKKDIFDEIFGDRA